MTNREKRLRKRKRDYKWSQIGMIGVRKCPVCDGTNTIQIYRYDAWACRDCNEWLEKKCGDPACPYCKDRPETPYEAYWRSDLSTGSAHERKMWRRNNYHHKKAGELRRYRKFGDSVRRFLYEQGRDIGEKERRE